MDDLDDFVDVNPQTNKRSKVVTSKSKSSDLTYASKWQGTAFATQLKTATSGAILLEKTPNFVADLKLPGDCFVLIIHETDYVGGCKDFKKKLAKFFKCYKTKQSIVICQRTEVTATEFVLVETFCVIDLGLPIIPVKNLDQIPQIIQQLIQTGPTGKKVNPFIFGLPKSKQSGPNLADKELIQILQEIPGLGGKKINLILEHYSSLYEIAEADQIKLGQVIGKGSASAVWNYFNSAK